MILQAPDDKAVIMREEVIEQTIRPIEKVEYSL